MQKLIYPNSLESRYTLEQYFQEKGIPRHSSYSQNWTIYSNPSSVRYDTYRMIINLDSNIPKFTKNGEIVSHGTIVEELNIIKN